MRVVMAPLLDPDRLGDHIDRLYRAAWALSGSREDAEDLVQETYARVLSRPRLLRREDDLGYLLRAPRGQRSPPPPSRPPSSTPRSRRCPTTSATSSSPSTSRVSPTGRRRVR